MGAVCCSEGIALLFSDESGGRSPRSARPRRLSRCGVSQLLETYDISQELLGTGSFGIIRRATSKQTGAPCALKSLEKQSLPEFLLNDLANEIRIQGGCCHPNIVQIYESFEDMARYYIAMEACEGGDFRDFMHDHGRLSERDAGIVMWQLLDAVRYLHEVKHVAHRDLKVENMLLTFRHVPLEQNVVKITDFGMATNFTPGESNLKMLCGTPEYLAPEVVYGRYNEKCDIWSCGIILYEVLRDELPFDAESPSETIWLARVNRLPLDWEHSSEDVKALLRSLCRKDPQARLSAEQAMQSIWLQQWEPSALSAPNPSGVKALEILDVAFGANDIGEGCGGRSPVSSEAKTTFALQDPDGSKTTDLADDTLSAAASVDTSPDRIWDATSSSDENNDVRT